MDLPPGPGGAPPTLPEPPAQDPHGRPAVPWGIVDAVVVFLVAMVLVALAANILTEMVRGGGLHEDVADALLLPLSLILLGGPTVGWIALRHRAAPALTGDRYGRWRDVAVGIGAGILAWILINQGIGLLIELFLREPPPALQPEFRAAVCDQSTMPYFIVGAVVVAPIAEELFFRGLLFQALRKRVGMIAGAVLSALVFGLLHMSGDSTLAAVITFSLVFPLGVFLAVFFHRRRTLVAPISAHVMFNILSVLVLAIASPAC